MKKLVNLTVFVLFFTVLSCKTTPKKLIDNVYLSKRQVDESITELIKKSTNDPTYANCLPMAENIQNKIYQYAEDTEKLINTLQEFRVKNEKTEKQLIIAWSILSSLLLAIAGWVALKLYL